MHVSSLELLRRLSPVPPASVQGALPRGRTQAAELFETRGFDELLTIAVDGGLRSERPITVASDLDPPLSDEALERLATAADRAEAHGVQRALMMLDGRGLEVDVSQRLVVSELRAGDRDAILRVDAAVVVGGDANAEARRAGPPFAGINDINAARLRSVAIRPAASSSDAPDSR